MKRSRGHGDRWVRGVQWRGDGRERRGGQRVVIPGNDLTASSGDDGRWNSGHSWGHGQRGGGDQSGGRHRRDQEYDALKNRGITTIKKK